MPTTQGTSVDKLKKEQVIYRAGEIAQELLLNAENEWEQSNESLRSSARFLPELGFRPAGRNATSLRKWDDSSKLTKVRTTAGKSYIAGAGEKGTSKTCCYCSKFKPKLEVSDKMYRCLNEGCKKEYPRDPGAAKSNTVVFSAEDGSCRSSRNREAASRKNGFRSSRKRKSSFGES